MRLYCFLRLNLNTRIFLARPLADDGGLHFAGISAGQQFAAVLEDGQGGKFDFGADFTSQFSHAEHLAGSYPVLFSAGFENRVHDKSLDDF